jgi:dipeptidase
VEGIIPRGTDKNHETLQSEYPVYRPRFEPGTYRPVSRSNNHLNVKLLAPITAKCQQHTYFIRISKIINRTSQQKYFAMLLCSLYKKSHFTYIPPEDP